MDFLLYDCTKLPAIAFGTGTSYFNRNAAVSEGIVEAFRHGYRHIDTAIMYDTEEGVGDGVRRLVNEEGFKRRDIFVTTKVNADQYTYEKAMKAMKESLKRLKLDYVDLIMVHSPGIPPGYKFVDQSLLDTFPKTPEALKEARLAMWEALQKFKADGKVKNIGVSNFNRFHIEQLISNPRCTEVPAVNQIELNPLCVDEDIINVCRENKILVQAYAPLGSGKTDTDGVASVLNNKTLMDIAAKQGCTVAQVALKWALSKGVAVVTKTENESRMKENLAAENVHLTTEDVDAIDQLNINQHLFWKPNDIP